MAEVPPAEGSLSKMDEWWAEDSLLKRGSWFVEGCGAEGSPLRTVVLWAEDNPCWRVWWWPRGREQQWWCGVGTVAELEPVCGTVEALVWSLSLGEGMEEEHSPWLGSRQEDSGHR